MTLKDLRISKKMSQKELADAIGVHVSIVSKYEKGKISIPTKRLIDIAYALDIEPHEILSNEQFYPGFYAYEKRLSAQESAKSFRNKEFYVKKLILINANGHCELCQKEAPFMDKNGLPYLEIHRIDNDCNKNELEKCLVALCPNCNARVSINPSAEDVENLRVIASRHDF